MPPLNLKKKLEPRTSVPLHDQVYEIIRNDLLSMRYKVGQKMPTTPELLKRYKVNSSTLQRAMTRLVKEGYVERAPRRGTFVKHSPASAKILILSKEDLNDESSSFSRTLVHSLEVAAGKNDWTVGVIDGLDGTKADANKIELFKQLNQRHPFRGVIEVNTSGISQGLFTDASNLYTSGFGSGVTEETVSVDYAEIADETVQSLKKDGANHIYYLRTDSGIPLGTNDKAALKKAATAEKVKLTIIELTEKGATSIESLAFAHVSAAVAAAGKSGILFKDSRLRYAIEAAVLKAGKSVPVAEISCGSSPGLSSIPSSTYEVSVSDLSKKLVKALDEKMTAEAGDIIKPAFTAEGSVSSQSSAKVPSQKDLKKAWK